MKIPLHYSIHVLLLILWGSHSSILAQEDSNALNQKDLQVKKYTVLARYEPGLVIPAEERMQLKSDRLITIQERRAIIDTLSISERKRRRLLKELYRSPFSYHWDKVIADIEAEEEDEENP